MDALFSDNAQAAQNDLSGMEKEENAFVFPLSFTQQRFWVLDQLAPGEATYTIAFAARVSGLLDIHALQQAINAVVERHEALRTIFAVVEGQPAQLITATLAVPLQIMDLQDQAANRREEEAWQRIRQEVQRPFHLSEGPLLRATLLQFGEMEYFLLLTVHHIIVDGWSMNILFRELSAFYKAAVENQSCLLPPLPIQYADFTQWQHEHLQGDVFEQTRVYWRQQLNGCPILELPADRRRPALQTFNGAVYSFQFESELLHALQDISRNEQATLFMTLLTAFNVLLMHYSGQTDLIIGSPIANRQQPELEGVIGSFINTLVLRTNLTGNPGFREALARVRETCLQAYEHQDMPFEQLIEILHIERDISRSPLVQVMFDLQSTAIKEDLRLADLTVQPLSADPPASALDLTLILSETATGLQGWIEYNTDLFNEDTIVRFTHHLHHLLQQVIANPYVPIEQISLLTEDERQQMLSWGSPSAGEFTGIVGNPGIDHLITIQAERTPDALAVVREELTLTYQQLNLRAEQVAISLLNRGVRPGTIIGLYVERSLDMAVALLGILKAGCAYLPLDPHHPRERLVFMIEDAQAVLLLTQSHLHLQLSEILAGFSGSVQQPAILCLDTEFPPVARNSIDSPHIRSANQPAYLIYTSGSTGQPKGVLITHQGLINHSIAIVQHYALRPQDHIWQFASISFDVAAEEIFPTWLAGATVVLRGNETLPARGDLVRLIVKQQLSVLNLPATYWQAWIQELASKQWQVPEMLRLVVVGSERVPPAALDVWHRIATPSVRLINAYGTTESTITTTLHELPAVTIPYPGMEVPIGRPIEHTQAYVLNRHMQLVPVGVPGELFLGGAGLSQGYHRCPDLTAASFVPHPFSYKPGSRLYRTGDLARYLSDGNIELLGRIDSQVKLNGFRIEPGEIEEILREHPAIQDAVVHLREDTAGDKRLVAYIVLHAKDQIPDVNELRQMMRKHLPEYMLPAAVVTLERLPLSPNGKVQRNALPIPEATAFATNPYIAPETTLEQTIAGIWKNVLGRQQVGVHDNFFDLGGSSLLMIRVHSLLLTELKKDIDLIDLFQYPSIQVLAQHLGAQQTEALSPISVTKSKKQQREQQRDIAVIGMAGRFPGAKNVETFWQNLTKGLESIALFTDEELLSSDIDQATLNDPYYVKAFGLLEGIEMFDASFFNVTPREAQIMNPQQRLFLECAWEALEHAGYTPESFPGRIGLYAGAGSNSYMQNILSNPDLAEFARDNVIIGNEKEYLTTRTSYKLNLKGPSINVQSACSTSLLAIHLACQGLLHGECDLALAGGVAIQMLRKEGSWYQEGGILSPDGHCRAFDAQAQGTVAGDGVGIVVLKPLDTALAQGDYIHAIIKGSATNNDGAAKVGYTAPSVEGQAQVISAAQSIAAVEPETIQYVEAHGTGTILGDPIEVLALNQAFRAQTEGKGFCALGSVKTNIGHLDAAAGIAGFIKTVLSLEHKLLLPSLHFQHPNPRIDFANSAFYVNTELTAWPENGSPRRAGVSSFGIGGTNVHVVLEEAPRREASGPSRSCQILMLSATSNATLEANTTHLAAYLQQHMELNLSDIAYTLQVGRKAFEHRRIVLCHDISEALSWLEAPDTKHVATRYRQSTSNQYTVFLFPGQGTQYVQMAAECYQTEILFQREVDHCAKLLYPHLQLDLRHILYPEPSQIEQAGALLQQTAIAQPALFVVEYALARLLMSWGIHPSAMIGHSIGEYVAACLAGVFSLEDGLFLVSQRGRLMQQCSTGSMLAVSLPEKEILPLLGADLSLAAINSSSLCVVSGPQEAIQQLAEQLLARDVEVQCLHTSHAFHSWMMDPIMEEFEAIARQVTLHPPQIPYLSNVTGSWITETEATDARYWARHIRAAVRFADGARELVLQSPTALLEVGPGRTLSTILRRHSGIKQDAVLPLLRHPHDQDADVLLSALGKLWLMGVQIDWTAFYAHEKRQRIPLPTYAFERQRYWIDAHKTTVGSRLEQPLEGKRTIDDWLYAPIWQQSLPPFPYERGAGNTVRWLIFSDRGTMSAHLLKRLEEMGHEVVLVTADEQFSTSDNNTYTLHPRRRQNYDALLQELQAQGKLPQHIVHLWSVTSQEDDSSPGMISEKVISAYNSIIYLVQALADQHIHNQVQLSIISNGLQKVTGEEQLYPEKALLSGPCIVIPQECPYITCRSIDIALPIPEGRRLEELVELLAADLLLQTPDTVVAYRGNQRWIRKFEPVHRHTPSKRPARLREQGVYLITGGLGGIGLQLAAYLAQAARARLMLVGRSRFPERATWDEWLATHAESETVSTRIRQIREMEHCGAQVQFYQADISDQQQVQNVLHQTYQRFGALHGVIHAAGIAGGGVIQLQTPEKIQQTLNPKVQGTLLLASLLKDAELDFFVLCSSLRSIVGGFGAIDYCAASTFLDAFAHNAKSWHERTFTVSINWDSWSQVGMSAKALQYHAQQAENVEGISPEQGVEIFRRILDDTLPQVIVSTNDLYQEIERESILAAQRLQQETEQKLINKAEQGRPELHSAYAAPQTSSEQVIATIWQDLLGITPIGVHDNFFELGGDSIVALQIAAKAKQFHLQLLPKDIFENQTIALLSTVIRHSRSIKAEQGLVTGIVPLMPIQRWFFEQHFTRPHHWNMAFLLRVPGEIDAHLLEQALQQIIIHHDALRLHFIPAASGWQQMNTDAAPLSLTRVDLSGRTASEQSRAIREIASELQGSLNLGNGPLLQAALFLDGTLQPGKVLIIIHHLVFDIVSWQILLQDLQTIYQQLHRGEAVTLPEKTTSFKLWAEYLTTYAQSHRLQKEVEYWLATRQQPFSSLPVDNASGSNTEESIRSIQVSLSVEETHTLLQDIPAMAHVQVSDLLLTALTQVITQWAGQQGLWIDLEHHGREPLFEDVDLSRTVGWFTSVFPVPLSLEGVHTLRDALQKIKEQLGRIPARGIGYGLLRYLCQDEAIATQLAMMPQPQVAFLYQGRADDHLISAQQFELLEEPHSLDHSPEDLRTYLFEINARVREGRLHLEWGYSSHMHNDATIEGLIERYVNALRVLIDYCRHYQTNYTPYDFPDANLSQEDLNELVKELTTIDSEPAN